MTTEQKAASQTWPVALATKPDFDQALARIYAWYDQEIVDRVPVRFSRHNALYDVVDTSGRTWPSLQARWFDAEYQLEKFEHELAHKAFLGETFPVFWPNLGPNVLAGFYGCHLEYGEVTSWAEPILDTYARPVEINWHNPYLAKLDELTQLALTRCQGRYLVGYTDLHPGIDWVAALRDSQQLCFDLFDEPEQVQRLLHLITRDFLAVYDHFDRQLKAHDQLSVTWMEIPSFGRMHIPSCDFATMISPAQFREFVFPALAAETLAMSHNVFHMDGKGVARHLDMILELPNVQAIQWVQGVGVDKPILQWIPLIQKIQAAGKSVVVDLEVAELEPFIDAVNPQGILLCLPSEDETQEREILQRLLRWS